MAFLNEGDRKKLVEFFSRFPSEVEVILFTQAINCEYCEETELLLKEVSSLSDKIKLTIKNFAIDKKDVESYKIERIPAIVIKRKDKDYGIRFFGIPAGYEFTTLIEAMRLVSEGESSVNEELKNKIKGITKPVIIQVFVTPTCPYCPRAVLTAFQIAMENENVQAHAIEVSEYPELVRKYHISSVPKTVVSDRVEFVGAVPAQVFVENVMRALEA